MVDSAGVDTPSQPWRTNHQHRLVLRRQQDESAIAVERTVRLQHVDMRMQMGERAEDLHARDQHPQVVGHIPEPPTVVKSAQPEAKQQ